MKIIKLEQHCTVERQGKFGWEPTTVYEPVFVAAAHIESVAWMGNSLLRMTSGDTIKVKETPEEILKLLEATDE